MKTLPFGTNRRTVLHRWSRPKVVLHEHLLWQQQRHDDLCVGVRR